MTTAATPSLHFIPLSPRSSALGLVFCVAVRAGVKPPESIFVLLRSELATRVYLGASLDAAGRVIEWLELWVQTASGLADGPETWRAYLTNAKLDAQWSQDAARFVHACGGASRQCGWESIHPAPLFIDLTKKESWSPKDAATGKPFLLCTDDEKLAAADLPTYSRSLHRYWLAENAGEGGSIWVAVTLGARTAMAAVSVDKIVPAGLVPFNPEGGLMQIRRLAPLDIEAYLDLLAGRPWSGLAAGKDSERLTETYGALGDWDRLLQGGEHFFLGGRGRAGVFIESFHLRLQAIFQMVRLTAEAVKQRQLPFLNIKAETFRVELGSPGPGLPLMWTAGITLAVPGQSVELPLKESGLHHFLPLAAPATTIYRPRYLSLPVQGRGTVRLRRVGTDTSGQVFVEGTFVTREPLDLTPSDLVWFKLPLDGAVANLYATVDLTRGMADGESRFQTAPLRMDSTIVRLLRAAEGNMFPQTSFETIPALSTPCDLYALGVLAVRALLVNGENTLSMALDEMLSLARQMGNAAAEGDAVERVRGLVASDPRWLSALGPQRLSREGLSAEGALTWLPEELWWRTISVVARFFPGQGRDSYCKDFADFSPYGLEKVFSQPLQDLEELLRLSRGMMFSDWVGNQQVAAVLARMRR